MNSFRDSAGFKQDDFVDLNNDQGPGGMCRNESFIGGSSAFQPLSQAAAIQTRGGINQKR